MSQVRANSCLLRSEARAAARLSPQRAQSIEARNPSQADGGRPEIIIIASFWVANVVVSLMMSRYPIIATMHGLAALAFGLYLAFSGHHLERVAYAAAYIAGSEVLWRMNGSQLFWEFAKYATVAMFFVAICRSGRIRPPTMPFLYFLLLIPSAVITVMAVGLDRARQLVSFNLSGALALMVSAWFFSNLKLSKEQLKRMFQVLIGPVIGIGTLTLLGTVTAQELTFTDESNFATSGGFGPNQVSAALGLGVLLALFHVWDGKTSWKFRGLMLGVTIFLAIQAALTFSRGGLYTAAGAAVLAAVYLIKDPRSRFKFILAAVFIFVLAQYIVIPGLDQFTGGALSARFENTDTSHRAELALSEIGIWMENPVFGTGPGQSHPGMNAHTEFTRLLAEHGMFGLIALILLFVMALQNLKRARTNKDKAAVASMVGWGVLYMLDKAMRLAAPCFTFGLSFATLLPDSEEVQVRPAQKTGFKNKADLRLAGLRPVRPSRVDHTALSSFEKKPTPEAIAREESRQQRAIKT